VNRKALSYSTTSQRPPGFYLLSISSLYGLDSSQILRCLRLRSSNNHTRQVMFLVATRNAGAALQAIDAASHPRLKRQGKVPCVLSIVRDHSSEPEDRSRRVIPCSQRMNLLFSPGYTLHRTVVFCRDIEKAFNLLFLMVTLCNRCCQGYTISWRMVLCF